MINVKKKKLKMILIINQQYNWYFSSISLIPGVSRSGISITAARFLNFKRFDSAKISFLLSIPTLAASFFGLSKFY